jgi:HEAT repeat protein
MSVAIPEDDQALACLQRISALTGEISQPAVHELIRYLGDEDPLVRWQAGLALANTAMWLRRRAHLGASIWDRQATELTFSGLLMLLRQGLKDTSPERRAATADALALWDHEVVVAFLIEAMSDKEPDVRVSVANALGRIRDKAAVSVLLAALQDPCAWVRRAAADALGAITDPKTVPALQQAIGDEQPLVRASVACALGHFHTARARETLELCVRDADPAMRWYAARGLGRIGNPKSAALLRSLRTDGSVLFGRSLASVANAAIATIEKRERGFWNWLRSLFYAIRWRPQQKPQS